MMLELFRSEIAGRYLLVAVGGALGSVARVAAQAALASRSTLFPWGTLSVNVAGSLIIGFLAGLWMQLPAQSPWRLFAMAGFLGGFTTFSSFSLENLNLLRAGRPWAALGYIALSLALGLAATALGYWTGKSFPRIS